ncbi:DNA polymerase III subunit epsilon [Betaproteobacteria bacterium PRO4]|uniref:DNA polymerase III subunit epsilon n=1 Tax=Nitrosomonas sp. TaxID=42353 RepID=UPI002567F76B|nr:DNA polymerase III subunit epsilon [Nitrosomonas sp.]MDL1866489.1 DNA polymerase III subunit epsilon [Betaproteobacteria bacterium PRO4]
MRQVFLDTETTGLDPALGHRIVEIAAVEMNNRRLTGRHFHRYLNPGRESDEGALRVHGLTREFLRDKPVFQDICSEFLAFIEGSRVLIHNAPFDTGFINHELGLIRFEPMQHYCVQISDTLMLAKELHPGKRNNLDALCERYQIDNSHRTLHGALLDAELLAEIYLAMTRGQESLLMEADVSASSQADDLAAKKMENLALIVQPATQAELELHDRLLERIRAESKGNCMWDR